jgi:hypothetical protein
LRTRAIQEPVFSVANTDFEGGDNDNGYGDYIFLVIYAQPSHAEIPRRLKYNLEKKNVIKTTPKKGNEHFLLCWPAGVKKKSRG